jgi:hypothetical protein
MACIAIMLTQCFVIDVKRDWMEQRSVRERVGEKDCREDSATVQFPT